MRKRIFIVLGILFSVYLYLAFRWVGALRLPGWALAGVLVLLLGQLASLIWFFTVFRELEESEHKDGFFEKAVQWLIFSGMGFFSFVFTFTVARDLLSLVFWPFGFTSLYTPLSFWVIFAAAFLSFATGCWIARFGLEVVRTDVELKGLPTDLDGFTIAQISDLHIGATLSEGFIKRVVEKVNHLDANLIVLTGDIIDAYWDSISSKVDLLKNLRARDGRFYITGNHEYYWDAAPVIVGMPGLGFPVLSNRHVSIQKGKAWIHLAGVPDYMSTSTGGPAPSPAQAIEGSGAGVRILLAHQPDFAREAEAAGFDLMLSGHTHGGQFFPWTLIIGFFHQFPGGLGKLGKMWIYVNRGTGFWGPPVRLGASPEISLLRLKRV